MTVASTKVFIFHQKIPRYTNVTPLCSFRLYLLLLLFFKSDFFFCFEKFLSLSFWFWNEHNTVQLFVCAGLCHLIHFNCHFSAICFCFISFFWNEKLFCCEDVDSRCVFERISHWIDHLFGSEINLIFTSSFSACVRHLINIDEQQQHPCSKLNPGVGSLVLCCAAECLGACLFS